VLMGALLLATVMVMPQGFVFGISQLVSAQWRRRARPNKSRVSDRDARSQMSGSDNVAP
jgi:hypothetical protein